MFRAKRGVLLRIPQLVVLREKTCDHLSQLKRDQSVDKSFVQSNQVSRG